LVSDSGDIPFGLVSDSGDIPFGFVDTFGLEDIPFGLVDIPFGLVDIPFGLVDTSDLEDTSDFVDASDVVDPDDRLLCESLVDVFDDDLWFFDDLYLGIGFPFDQRCCY
jgi:hypothetical protein